MTAVFVRALIAAVFSLITLNAFAGHSFPSKSGFCLNDCSLSPVAVRMVGELNGILAGADALPATRQQALAMLQLMEQALNQVMTDSSIVGRLADHWHPLFIEDSAADQLLSDVRARIGESSMSGIEAAGIHLWGGFSSMIFLEGRVAVGSVPGLEIALQARQAQDSREFSARLIYTPSNYELPWGYTMDSGLVHTEAPGEVLVGQFFTGNHLAEDAERQLIIGVTGHGCADEIDAAQAAAARSAAH